MSSTSVVCESFTLRQLLDRLPHDGASRFVRVSGVPSTIPTKDIAELFETTEGALEWSYCCHITRTDFVVATASEETGRKMVEKINSRASYHGARLRGSFTTGLPPPDALEYRGPAKVFKSSPQLYYLLPSQADNEIARRKSEAAKQIALLRPINPQKRWVDHRD